jgi:hypothetical protein
MINRYYVAVVCGPCRVIVALTTLALIRLLANAGPPRGIVVEVLTFVAVQSHRVVRAFTFAVHHIG